MCVLKGSICKGGGCNSLAFTIGSCPWFWQMQLNNWEDFILIDAMMPEYYW